MKDDPLKSSESRESDDSLADSDPAGNLSAEESVEIEDGSLPEPTVPVESDDDEPSLLDSTARELEGDSLGAGESLSDASQTRATASADQTPEGDCDWPGGDEVPVEAGAAGCSLSWVGKVNPREVMVELKAIEAEVREALVDRDSRRKRRFAGTRRWLELEEDLISWRFSGRIDEATLTRVQRLIARRHLLVRHLRFLSGTRPVWNS